MGRIPPPYGTPSIPPPPRFPFSCRFILFSPLQIRRRGLNPRHGPSACCQTSLRCKTAPDAPLGLCILYDEATHTGQPWRGPRPSHGVVSAYGRWPGPRATSVWAQHPRSQTIRHRETPPRSARPRREICSQLRPSTPPFRRPTSDSLSTRCSPQPLSIADNARPQHAPLCVLVVPRRRSPVPWSQRSGICSSNSDCTHAKR